MPAPLSPPFPVAPASRLFRIAPGVYLKHLLAGPAGKKAIIIPALLVAGCVAAAIATSDWRFILVALMLVFIAVPMVMALIYFSITLSPEATRSTLLHSVELCSDGSIMIAYADHDDTSRKAPVADEAISPEEIISFRFSDEYLVYRLVSGRLLIIPLKDIDLPCDRHCQFRDFD